MSDILPSNSTQISFSHILRQIDVLTMTAAEMNVIAKKFEREVSLDNIKTQSMSEEQSWPARFTTLNKRGALLKRLAHGNVTHGLEVVTVDSATKYVKIAWRNEVIAKAVYAEQIIFTSGIDFENTFPLGAGR